MTDEELEKLQCEVSEKIEQLPDTSDDDLSYKERRHRIVLRARKQALDRMKKAREDGNTNREVKAGIDYTLLTEYGERNILLYYFMKVRLSWWQGI